MKNYRIYGKIIDIKKNSKNTTKKLIEFHAT